VPVPIVAAACTIAAITWAYLLTGHGRYWRTGQRLPPAGADPAAWPSVIAVVPARNEAALLPDTLPTLLGQDYPGAFGVVVVDDDSSDGTAEIARAIGGSSTARLRVVPGSRTPAGWAGKVWAMEQGLRAAGDAGYVLFTDADISYAPGALTALVRAAEADDRGLVSQMALLRAGAFWERLLVPAFVYFFAQLYPFQRVNRPGARTAAAAGGCMLVRGSALAAAGGLERIRGARIDDVALARLLKGPPARVRCWLGLTTNVVSRRPYPRLAGLWDMIARSAYTQLRYSPAALAGTLAGLLWLYALPPAAAVGGLAWLAAGGGTAVAWLAAAGLVAVLYAAMTADSARRYHLGRGGQWKGRTIPAARRG
jgi:hopene-associated glycosyltransferase HpnB